MCENHDGLSHRSISEQRRLHSPSGDEQETELEPSLEQDEDDRDQDQSQEEQEKDLDGDISPSRKKEFKVNVGAADDREIQLSWLQFNPLTLDLLVSVFTFFGLPELFNAINMITANSKREKSSFDWCWWLTQEFYNNTEHN